MLLQAVIITGCDLCASAKPWDIQLDLVKSIFDEFYKEVLSACLWRLCLLHALSLYTLRSYCGCRCFVSVVKYIYGKSTKNKLGKQSKTKPKTESFVHLNSWPIYFDKKSLIVSHRKWYVHSIQTEWHFHI